MADEEINYESDAGLDSIFFTRPKGPNPPPTPYLYVANCGAEAEMTYAALADVFSSFGHVRRVVPAGAANLTRIFVVFGGRSRAEASAAAEAALQALSGKPCADAGGRKMHIQFAVGKRSAPVEHPVVHHNVDALAIPGLFLHLDFVTPEMEQTRDIEKDKWIGPLPAAVSDFVSRAEQLPELTGCPEVCMPLDQLTEGRGGPGEENAAPSTSPLLPFFSLSPYATDQRINESATGINEYGTGVGLAPHIDTHAAFEGAVLSLSLAGPAIMEFRRPLGPQPVGKQPLGKKKVVGGSSGSSEQGVGSEISRGSNGKCESSDSACCSSDDNSRGNGAVSGVSQISTNHSSSNSSDCSAVRAEEKAGVEAKEVATPNERRAEENREEERRAEERKTEERRAEDRRVLFLPPRSLLVLTGEARYAWSHYIPNHKIDHINGQVFPRAPRRVSYTFRRVRFGPCGCAYPEFCDAPRMESVAGNGKVSTDRDRAAGSEGMLVEGSGAEKLLVKQKGREGMRERVGDGCCGGSVVTHSHEGVAECGEEGEKGKKEEQRMGGGNDGEPVMTHSHEGVEERAEEERAEREDGKESSIPPHVDPPNLLYSPQTTPAVERDFVHKVYDAIAPHFSATRFARWPKVAEFLLSLPPGSLVLDAGCGNGKYLNGGLPIPPALPSAASVSVSASSSLSMRTSSSPFPSSSSTPSSSTPFPPSSSPSSAPTRPPAVLIGCDISPPLVSICTQRGFEAFVADTLSLPLASSRFDAAISVAVLHHLSSETRRKHALREMLRVVRKGGRVLVTVWAREQENPGLLDKWTPLIGRMADKWVGDVEAGGGEEKGGEREGRAGGGLGGIEEERETSNEENACPRRGSAGKEVPGEKGATAGEGMSEESAAGGSGEKNPNPELGRGGSGEERTGESEQGKVTGEEASQEFLVPWHLPCHRVEIGSAAAAQHVASGFARRDEAKGSVVYNRYYYVFTQGELERLITEIGGASIVESFYDKSNWCVIMEKL
ncbi:unnamed protein product [Closterium sp. NIES-65]|nr:unnamed protein product [Closterium sp. NIES-65]